MNDTQEQLDTTQGTPAAGDAQDNQQPDVNAQDLKQQGQDEQQEQKPELTAAEKEARALRRRIDRLTRSKYENEARARQLEQELQQYRQQHGGEGQQGEPQQSATDVEARAREIADQRAFNARCDAIVEQGSEKFPDFTDKVKELSQELPLFKSNGRPEPILETILDSEDPAALIYHLGQNPDVAAEIAELSPRQQARRLVKLELELSGSAKQQKGAAPPAAPAVTKAPPPIQPNRTASGQFTKDPAAMTDAEWYESQRKSA